MIKGIEIASSVDIIVRIEKALGFKLYPSQIDYIFGVSNNLIYDTDRRIGKTTAFCIKLALSSGNPLDIRYPESFSDAGYSGLTVHQQRYYYSKSHFLPTFLRIRDKLSTHGFKVRDIYNSRQAIGGFIVGD